MNVYMEMQLEQLGIPIVEHCNLNCKGCLHFCNGKQKRYFIDRLIFKKELEQIKKIIKNVLHLRIYGGEPLLHPFIGQLLEIAREIFPKAKIELLTNGILLPKMDIPFWNTLKKLHIEIVWSVYPINNRLVESIEKELVKNEVTYRKNITSQFYGIFNPNGNSDPKYQWEHCSGKKCHVLREGYISACPAPAIVHIINETFGTTIDFSSSQLSIYNPDISARDILLFLAKHHDVCRYCTSPRMFDWDTQDELKLNDWYGREGHVNENSIFSN